MSILVEVLNAVPRAVLHVEENGKPLPGSELHLGQTTKPLSLAGSLGIKHHETGAVVPLSSFNLNGPYAVVRADGFEGAFYKVQAVHAYKWGFTKDATFTYVYAMEQDQPPPTYYPVLYPRIVLATLASNTRSEDLFMVTVPTPQSSFPALQLLSGSIVLNEYTQTVQQEQNPYMVYGGTCGHGISSSFF